MQFTHVFCLLSVVLFAVNMQGAESGAVKATGNEACNCVGDVLKIGPAKPCCCGCCCAPDCFERALCSLSCAGRG